VCPKGHRRPPRQDAEATAGQHGQSGQADALFLFFLDLSRHLLLYCTKYPYVCSMVKLPDQIPPYAALMEALVDTMDRAQIPAEGGNSAAGKAILRQITAAARAQIERIKQAKDTKQTIHQGATNDNR
jgi:hypothetical protein